MYAATKTCKDFILDYGSKGVTCFSCKHWNKDDFVCMEKGEVANREFDRLEKEMMSNRPICGPL